MRMYVYGQNFLKKDTLKVKFTYEGSVVKEVEGIYKNPTKIGCLIPDMGEEVPVGQHLVVVEVTLNGQQYSSNGITFLFNSVDPALSEEELKKLDEADEKGKKPAGKKK